jgi:hypothetical protein
MLVRYRKWGPFRAKLIGNSQLIEACVDRDETTITHRKGEGYVDAYLEKGTEITEYEYALILNKALDILNEGALKEAV